MELPQTAVEWADENFYLSPESSGTVGRWNTLPYQVAILNAMGSPDVQKVTLIKSARVGFTKMMMAAVGYFVVKRKRSVALWQPTDNDRNEFVKDEIDTAIRDVPCWKNVFPAFGKKSPENTVDRKAFIGATLWLKGATSPKNFRRISPDVSILDEVDAMPLDIGGEGTAEALSWKRAEVSSFRKQIMGSSPKEKGSSQIETAAEKADAFLKFQVECPNCNKHHPLVFGASNSKHGLKWNKGKPESVKYVCPHCHEGWANSKLYDASVSGHYLDEKKGISTKDGLVWLKDGERISAPRSVAFHVWSAYSPYTTWREIITDWLEAKQDTLQLKSFVNTTLGETWTAQEGDTIKPAQVKMRKTEPMPVVLLATCAVDVQGDRFELQFVGHCENGDMVPLGYEIIPAEPDRIADWRERLAPRIDGKTFEIHGRILEVEGIGVDTGGSSTATAYDFCALNSDKNYFAFKGGRGDRPIVPMKASRNWKKRGLDGWMIGVNAAKDLFFTQLSRTEGDGRIVFVDGVELPDDYVDQITAEKRVLTIRNNKRSYNYEKKSESAPNEALDLWVYNIAVKKLLQVQRGVDLAERAGQTQEYVKPDFSSIV